MMSWRYRVAALLRRFPWTGRVVQEVYRLWQPRFTVGVVGILLDASGERVFLVEHMLHTRKPWGLPGGWIERGEDPAQTVEREFFEETGLRVRALYPLLVQRTVEMRGHMDIVYLCALDGDAQTIRLSGELLSCGWVAWDDLPPLVAFHEKALRMARDVVAKDHIRSAQGRKL